MGYGGLPVNVIRAPNPFFGFYFVLCCILHFCCICIFVICSMGMGGKEVRGYGWLACYSNPSRQPILCLCCICIFVVFLFFLFIIPCSAMQYGR